MGDKSLLVVALLAVAICAASPLIAEPADSDDGNLAVESGSDQLRSVPVTKLDFSIPTQPAAQLLGIGASDVQRPHDLRELLVSVIDSFDRRGNLQRGFAYSVSGWETGLVEGTSGQYSRQRPWLDAEYSIVAVKGATDADPSSKVAIGISLPLVDRTQPLQTDADVKQFYGVLDRQRPEGLSEIVARLRESDPSFSRAEDNATLGQVRTQLLRPVPMTERSEEAVAAEREFWAMRTVAGGILLNDEVARRWNARALAISAAFGWVSPAGLADEYRSDSYGLWLRGAEPRGEHGQLLYAASYRSRELIPDPDNQSTLIRRNVSVLGVKYAKGQAAKNMSLEVSYRFEKMQDRDSEHVWTYLFGYERRVADNQWLQASIGTEGNRSTGSETLFGLTFNVGMGSKPQIIVQ